MTPTVWVRARRAWCLGALALVAGCSAKTQRLLEPDVCTAAVDCPGNFPPCENASGCGCGTFRMCVEGQCRAAAFDCPFDGGLADATATDATDAGAHDASASDASADDASATDASATDASTGDASVPLCRSSADCRGPDAPSLLWCSSSSYSCIDGACVWDCGGPRSCTFTPSACLACDGDAQTCPGRMCPIDAFVSSIEDATTGCTSYPGSALPWAGARVRVVSTARICSYAVELPGAAALAGTYIQLEDGTYAGTFPALGGTCTGAQAPTGALRIIFSCPLCQFVIGP